MSVAGSLASIDETLKRYTRGVDEWRATMLLLKDAEEEVGNIMHREILCVVFLYFFHVLYSFFSRVTQLIKASNSKKGRQYQSVAVLQPLPIFVSSSLALSIGGESPSPARSSFSSHLYQRLTIST